MTKLQVIPGLDQKAQTYTGKFGDWGSGTYRCVSEGFDNRTAIVDEDSGVFVVEDSGNWYAGSTEGTSGWDWIRVTNSFRISKLEVDS